MLSDMDPDHTTDTRQDRMSVAAAATYLGVTEDAVRKRIHRGRIRYDKDPDGRYFVYPASLEQDYRRPDTTDTGRDTVHDLLIQRLDSEVAYLRERLAEADERDREQRRIIAGLTARIPELPSPSSEAPESSVTDAEPVQGKGTPPEPQTTPERVPWWRRVFGG